MKLATVNDQEATTLKACLDFCLTAIDARLGGYAREETDRFTLNLSHEHIVHLRDRLFPPEKKEGET